MNTAAVHPIISGVVVVPWIDVLSALPWSDAVRIMPVLMVYMLAGCAIGYGLLSVLMPAHQITATTQDLDEWRIIGVGVVLLIMSWLAPATPEPAPAYVRSFWLRYEFVMLMALMGGWRGALVGSFTTLLLRWHMPGPPLSQWLNLLAILTDVTLHCLAGLLIRWHFNYRLSQSQFRPIVWCAILKQPMSITAFVVNSQVFEINSPISLLQVRIVGVMVSPVFLLIFGAMLHAELQRRQNLRDLSRANQELDHISHNDMLTGLPNRRALLDNIERLHQRQQAFSVIFADLDRFKPINDAFGHTAGDMVLRQISERLRQSVPADATCFRHGGDEFVVVLPTPETTAAPPNTTAFTVAEATMNKTAQRIQQALQAPFYWEGFELRLGVSMGGVHHTASTPSTPDDVLHNADLAMYSNKIQPQDQHSTCITVFEPHMREQANAKLRRDTQLRHALSSQALYMEFQPIVDTMTQRVVNAEALLRWNNGGRMVPPTEFLESAHCKNFGVNIDVYAMTQSIKQWAACEMHQTDVTLSINVLKFDLFHADLRDLFFDALVDTGVRADRVIFELTEHYLIDNFAACREAMTPFLDAGVRFALDDFGMGYSNLSYLSELPIAEIKIDKMFVQSAATKSMSLAIIHAAQALAEHCQAQVVAEGVETASELALLQSLGIQHMQGYLLGRPMQDVQLRHRLKEEAAYS